MLAVVPGESDELIQDPPLLGRRARLIPLGHGDHQLLRAPALIVDIVPPSVARILRQRCPPR